MATTRKKSTTKKKTRAKKAPAKNKKSNAISTKKTTVKKTVAKKTVTKATAKKAVKKPTGVFKKLNTWNWVMALLHTMQGVAVIVLGNKALQSITTNYLTVDTIASTDEAPVLVQATRTLFSVDLVYVVAAFFFISAIAHLIIATVYRKRYESDLKKGVNKARWYEYGVSASVMMIGIAFLSGISDLSTLVLIFGATMVMNLLGLVMEIHNQTTKKTNWLSFVIGSLVGFLPWVVVGLYLFGANKYGEGDIPSFVYWIYGSIFVFFSSFAVNMYLQYKKKGKWSDYLYGERSYMVLSLVAKSVLAWQVFAGTLRP